jgi:XRE family transcriptional regulator, aerobic/anaerobic benzoate catabolism transcriptional regulator
MPRTSTSDIDSKMVGAEIRAARELRGLTQAQLASELGVSGAYVQKLEAGRDNPTIGQLANVARGLQMSLRVSFAEPAPIEDPFAELAKL